MDTVQAWIGLGANLGDARATITRAIAEVGRLPQTRLAALSSLYRSAPIDANGPDFLNAVARVETALGPHALLDALQEIERSHGRLRPYRNAPRTLDLDLLAWDDTRIDDSRLTLPHPRLHQRAFVLEPLLEIAPGLRLPGLAGLDELRDACRDQRIERLLDAPALLAESLTWPATT